MEVVWSGRTDGRTVVFVHRPRLAVFSRPPLTVPGRALLVRPSVDWIVGWAGEMECRPAHKQPAGQSRLDRRRLRAAGPA